MGELMKAWRLSLTDERFDYRELPDPEPRVAGVTVRMDAAPLLSYLRAFVAGELPGYLPPGGEFTPGTNGVGVIDRVGAQVYGLAPGQRCCCRRTWRRRRTCRSRPRH